MKQYQHELREFYLSTHKPSLTPRVAIHIRRGDILDDMDTIPSSHFYFDPNERIRKCIEFVKEEHEFDEIHVFSQGKQESFAGIEVEGLHFVYHLDEDLKEAFHAMVMAEILIIGKSSFSWVPGYLNIGVVYSTWKTAKFNRGMEATDIPNWKGMC